MKQFNACLEVLLVSIDRSAKFYESIDAKEKILELKIMQTSFIKSKSQRIFLANS